MALIAETLRTALYAVFTGMGDTATDDDYAYGIGNAVAVFLKTGSVATVDGGTVTGGVFAGAGTQSLSTNTSISGTACASILKSACVQMKNMSSGGNDYLAEETGKALKKMASDIRIKTSVTGTLTPPSGTPVAPYPPTGTGMAEGSVTCDDTSLVSSLKTAFNNMWSRREEEGFDGNWYLADEMSKAVASFWKFGVVSTSGKNELSGSSGAGGIS